MINRDPEKTAVVSLDLMRQAIDLHKQVIHVIYDECSSSVDFIAIVDSVPRRGEIINLENGTSCVVMSIIWKVSCMRNNEKKLEYITLVPNVYAKITESQSLD